MPEHMTDAHFSFTFVFKQALSLPELNIRLGQSIILAALMTMPEATIDKDDCLVFTEHNIRRARKFSVMQTIAETMSVEITAHQHLRLSVG